MKRAFFRLKRFSLSLCDAGVLLTLAWFLFSQPRSLHDYERLCRETPAAEKRERLALQAVDFLLSQNVPDFIVQEIQQAAVQENFALADTLLFSDVPDLNNDSLAGSYEFQLAENLPQILYAKRIDRRGPAEAVHAAAQKIAAQLDARAQHAYWEPLLRFLENAETEAWQRWRAAARAASASRQAIRESQFQKAQYQALHGLRLCKNLPDERLKLDLYFRLQNALVEGRDSAYNIGLALADWLARTSAQAGYFLRVVGAEFNSGNQLFQLGRYEEALRRFQNVAHLTQRWRHFPRQHMQWYGTEVLERSAAVLYELGDYSGMMSYVNRYGAVAKEARQQTLYHLNRGRAARIAGDLQAAEEEFKHALAWGQGDPQRNLTPDPANVWYAHAELGALYLLSYQLPDESLRHFQAARDYAAGNDNILNKERLSTYWLYLAEAYLQKRDLPRAAEALQEAKQQAVDSPLLHVQNLFSAAQIHAELGQVREAAAMLKEAHEICRSHGMTLHEIDAILRQMALSFRAPSEFELSKYSAADLESLIAKAANSGAKQQLLHSLALAIASAHAAGQHERAKPLAHWLLQETEALSRRYDHEQRLVFFQHSIYEDVKAAICLDLWMGQKDSAFVKLDYVKSRSLRRRILPRLQPDLEASRFLFADRRAIQKQLRPDEAIIDYLVTADTLYAFVLNASGLQVFSSAANRRHLHAQITAYLAQLAPAHEKPPAYDARRRQQEFQKAIQLSHGIYNILLRRVMERLGEVKRLYIVADEFLHLLPFNTLALQEGPSPEFLIEHRAIMHLPASSLLPRAENNLRGQSLPPPSMLASIDPAMHGAKKICDGLTRLQNTKITVRTSWQSPAEIVAELGKPYGAYFFYAHAVADWHDPWQSYLHFPLASPPEGRLPYGEIDSIDWRTAGLVMLVGCETAGNRYYGGAGLSGLQRAFLAAGAQEVLATFWKVDAGQAGPQIRDFLAAWHDTGDAMTALQKMQQTAIARLKMNSFLAHPHPRYWGAYNLTRIRASEPFSRIQTAYAVQ